MHHEQRGSTSTTRYVSKRHDGRAGSNLEGVFAWYVSKGAQLIGGQLCLFFSRLVVEATPRVMYSRKLHIAYEPTLSTGPLSFCNMFPVSFDCSELLGCYMSNRFLKVRKAGPN